MSSLYGSVMSENSEKTPLLGIKANKNGFVGDAEQVGFDFISAKMDAEKRMYSKLKTFSMNPIEKWTHNRRFPWNMCIQFLVIILGMLQMSWFAEQRIHHLHQNSEMTKALNKMFLKNWKPTDSTHSNSQSVYSAEEFYQHMDFVVKQYGNLSYLNYGRYGYGVDVQNEGSSPLSLCIKQYEGYIDPGKLFINMKKFPHEKCLILLHPKNSSLSENKFSTADFLLQSNYSLRFDTLVKAELNFRLRTVVVKSMDEIRYPECYLLNITIRYDNTHHDGHISISKIVTPSRENCQFDATDEQQDHPHRTQQPLNLLIILSCVLSIVLCLRSLYRTLKLSQQTVQFFSFYHGKTIPFSEQMDFIDFWYITILVGDVMVIIGSFLKVQIEQENIRLSECTNCSFLLGIGYFLIFIGTLRYFRLFRNYNILLETLKRSMPHVIRYLTCVALLFFGYCFLGWMVLAPYHDKFATLSSTAENLFADMNGDGVYDTFNALETDSDRIWWFARIYFYSFFFLFLYLGASLLGSVIVDSYETVKHTIQHGKTPLTTVELFLASVEYGDVSSASSVSS